MFSPPDVKPLGPVSETVNEPLSTSLITKEPSIEVELVVSGEPWSSCIPDANPSSDTEPFDTFSIVGASFVGIIFGVALALPNKLLSFS